MDKLVLVVEDEETLLESLRYNLAREGYEVHLARDGLEALEKARSLSPQLILLDLMLPKLDGFEVCRLVRQESSAPILMLTARAQEVDRIVGLELGADDYITKPFSMRELLARVRAAFRRMEMLAQKEGAPEEPVVRVGEIEMDVARHRVRCRGKEVELRPREFDLLLFLMRNRGQVLSRDVLLERVWGYDFAGDTRTVDVHIRSLREKLERDPAQPQHILTVRGVGYRFQE